MEIIGFDVFVSRSDYLRVYLNLTDNHSEQLEQIMKYRMVHCKSAR